MAAIQSFQRGQDHFWVLAAHLNLNLFAVAGVFLIDASPDSPHVEWGEYNFLWMCILCTTHPLRVASCLVNLVVMMYYNALVVYSISMPKLFFLLNFFHWSVWVISICIDILFKYYGSRCMQRNAHKSVSQSHITNKVAGSIAFTRLLLISTWLLPFYVPPVGWFLCIFYSRT